MISNDRLSSIKLLRTEDIGWKQETVKSAYPTAKPTVRLNTRRKYRNKINSCITGVRRHF
jgi:hypothetical protein